MAIRDISEHRPGAWSQEAAPPLPVGADYLRRIHWWVRLFGIVWVVIPCLGLLFLLQMFLSAAAFSR